MALGYSTALRNLQAEDIASAVGSNGKLIIMDGTRPPTGGTLTNELVTLPLSTVAGTATGGVFTFNPITTTTAIASGTPTWARVVTSADVAVIDLSAGLSGSDINFNQPIALGGDVSITSLTITNGTP